MDTAIFKFALSLGMIWSWCVFCIAYLYRNREWSDKFIHMARILYRGYQPTLKGSLVGALWGFADGFLSGFGMAWIYFKIFN